MSEKIAFIGAGNMASALVHGLLKDGYAADQLVASDPASERREALAGSGVHTTDDNQQAIDGAAVVVLAVKPQIMETVCEDIQAAIAQCKPVVISIAAGISESSLQKWLGDDIAIVRTMPNTPAMLQAGATVLHANACVSESQRDLAESVMRAVGITRWLEQESQIDAATALSGSGPAYFFLIIEALEEAGIELGLPAETAHLLTLQTALGAARMAMESPESASQLRTRVTSPGGTTEAAIEHMQNAKLPAILAEAMRKAHERSIELSKTRD